MQGKFSKNHTLFLFYKKCPSNSKYGKLIKSCVQAPDGWLFVGLDFASLEDRISALTTKDKNKLKVYLENYDGHALRAYAYFGEEMPDIVLATQGVSCYKAKVGNTYICFSEHEQIEYCGQIYTGKELYEFLTNT